MFDREQFETEIKIQLKDLDEKKCMAFAARTTMRLLPLLSLQRKLDDAKKREVFWLWENLKEKENNLLFLFRIYAHCCEFNATLEIKNYYRYKESFFLASFDIAVAVQGVIKSGLDNISIINTPTAIYISTAKVVERAIYYVTRVNIESEFINEIKNDLVNVSIINVDEFLSLPLWNIEISDKWKFLLTDFEADVLSLNAGFEVWLDWYNERLQGNPINIDLLKEWNSISKELEAQGVRKVNAYLKNLREEKNKLALNRVRAIFIGYGEAGKTSLIRALHGEEVIKGTEAMTCGIEIRDWQVPNTDIQAHFWDFGGQVVFHSTHKFFLRSSCVYIIVINARADINNSEQAEYWLDHVKVFGGSAPVLLVGNKADEAQIHLQMQTLSQKYPNLKGFYPVSCTEAKTSYQPQFEIFKQSLTQELQAVGIHQMLFTPAQGKVLDELRQYSPDHAFLSENDFNQICDKHGISNEGELNRDWLVDIFDKLGVMLHFEELKTFHNAYMLNPRWLTHGVYTLMNAKQARLNVGDMVRILTNTKVEDEYKHLLTYEPTQCLFISQAMQRFKPGLPH